MLCNDVRHQLALPVEEQRAKVAAGEARANAMLGDEVFLQAILAVERKRAHVTHVWLLAAVAKAVAPQVGRV